jgi:hypothetical protein
MTDDTPAESDTSDGSDTGEEVDPAAVQAFLDDADSALAEYDRGYTDADATVRVLRRHLDSLRDAVEE